jgi:hypothetical protein
MNSCGGGWAGSRRLRKAIVALCAMGAAIVMRPGPVAAAASVRHTIPSTSATSSPSAAAVRREPLQFRPSAISVLHPAERRCWPPDAAVVPTAGRPAWVGWLGGCAHDGSVILSISTVRRVTAGYSCSGNVFVTVHLRRRDVPRFDVMVRREGSRIFGVVVLDRQLSIYTGDLLHTAQALAGDVQVVGGLPAHSRLPEEIARALGQPLRWMPSRTCGP